MMEKKMDSLFSGENKCLWGFSLTRDGNFNGDVKSISSNSVKKIIDYAYEANMEVHIMPYVKIPFIEIKTHTEIWHYLTSNEDAHAFIESIIVSGCYTCCQVV